MMRLNELATTHNMANRSVEVLSVSKGEGQRNNSLQNVRIQSELNIRKNFSVLH